MRILLVLAHPLENSFAASVARTAKESLEAKGHTVDLLDLYRDGFDPRLTVAERGSYFDERYDSSEVSVWVDRLKAADGLMLVFPQWWFNFRRSSKVSSIVSSLPGSLSTMIAQAAVSCRGSATSSYSGR